MAQPQPGRPCAQPGAHHLQQALRAHHRPAHFVRRLALHQHTVHTGIHAQRQVIGDIQRKVYRHREDDGQRGQQRRQGCANGKKQCNAPACGVCPPHKLARQKAAGCHAAHGSAGKYPQQNAGLGAVQQFQQAGLPVRLYANACKTVRQYAKQAQKHQRACFGQAHSLPGLRTEARGNAARGEGAAAGRAVCREGEHGHQKPCNTQRGAGQNIDGIRAEKFQRAEAAAQQRPCGLAAVLHSLLQGRAAGKRFFAARVQPVLQIHGVQRAAVQRVGCAVAHIPRQQNGPAGEQKERQVTQPHQHGCHPYPFAAIQVAQHAAGHLQQHLCDGKQ